MKEVKNLEGGAVLASDLNKIRIAGQQLLALIGDVLDLSKIKAGRMELYREVLDLAGLVEDVVTTRQPLVA